MLLIPPALERSEAYASLVLWLRDTLIKPKHLAQRWGFSEDHLANLRRRQLGPVFLRLPTSSGKAKRPMGAIRYPLSGVVAAELGGTGGPLTLERINLAVAACEFLSEQQRVQMIARLRIALC